MWYAEMSNGDVFNFDTELDMYRWLWEESQYASGMVLSYGRDYGVSDNLDEVEE